MFDCFHCFDYKILQEFKKKMGKNDEKLYKNGIIINRNCIIIEEVTLYSVHCLLKSIGLLRFKY